MNAREVILAALGCEGPFLLDEGQEEGVVEDPAGRREGNAVGRSGVPRPLKLDGGIELFETRFETLGGRIAAMADLAQLLDRPWWADDDAKRDLEGLSFESAGDIWDAHIGSTTCDFLVAETGSILIASGPGRRRMASLAPEIHVVLARKSQVVPSLDEALAALGDRHWALISGASRTADIEGTLVRGVHGPKELWLVWMN